MRYTPYTEAAIQSMNVMDEGTYDFRVIEVISTDKFNNPLQDKNGNDMAKLKLMVWDKDNKERIVYTFISGDGNFAYKLRHFAKTIGMLDDYEQGIFNINRSLEKCGKAHIVVKKGTMKTDGSGEMWADRNDVKDFVTVETQPSPPLSQPKSVAQQDADLNDDIPF